MLSRRDTLRSSLLAVGLCLARFFPPIPEKSKLSNPFEGLNVGDLVEVKNSFGFDGTWRVVESSSGEITVEPYFIGQWKWTDDRRILTFETKKTLDWKEWQA